MDAKNLHAKPYVWQWLPALLCLFFVGTAHAAMQEVTVTGIGVHPDIEKAQPMALDYAKRRALYEMALKWNVEDLQTKMQRLPAGVIAQSVRGARIVDFKREGDVLYTKTVVSVLDTPLKRALKVPLSMASNIPRGLGVLIIPVFKDGEQILVWDKSNPLRAPVRRAALTGGNQSVVVPLGDAKDLAEIDYDNILNARYQQFEGLLKRYGAKEVMVVLLTPPEGEDAPTRVLVNRIFKDGMKPELLEIKAKKGSNMAARYHDVAVTVVGLAAQRAAATSGEERDKRAKASAQPVIFRFTTMAEYGQVDKIVRAGPDVTGLEVKNIALQEVDGVLYHTGTPEKLREYLEKQSVKMREEGGSWVLSLR